MLDFPSEGHAVQADLYSYDFGHFLFPVSPFASVTHPGVHINFSSSRHRQLPVSKMPFLGRQGVW
jgi:hypothetical protein